MTQLRGPLKRRVAAKWALLSLLTWLVTLLQVQMKCDQAACLRFSACIVGLQVLDCMCIMLILDHLGALLQRKKSIT
jgi:hypothetical protein